MALNKGIDVDAGLQHSFARKSITILPTRRETRMRRLAFLGLIGCAPNSGPEPSEQWVHAPMYDAAAPAEGVDLTADKATTTRGEPLTLSVRVGAAGVDSVHFAVSEERCRDCLCPAGLFGECMNIGLPGLSYLGSAPIVDSYATVVYTPGLLAPDELTFQAYGLTTYSTALPSNPLTIRNVDSCTGTGAVARSHEMLVGPDSHDVAVGDFDGDGWTDIAGISHRDDLVMVSLGRGDGTFDPGLAYATGAGPYGIVSADFDGDGIDDLATANLDGDSISVLRSRADGTFDPAATHDMGGFGHDIASADVDGNGWADLVATTYGSGQLSVFLNAGDGSFPHRLAVDGPLSENLSLADFDGDGHVDVAFCEPYLDRLKIRRGSGDGAFSETVLSRDVEDCHGIDTGDIDADGDIDLVFTERFGRRVGVLLNDDAPGFGPIRWVDSEWDLRGVTLTDMDGDAVLDMVVAQFGFGGGHALVYPGRGDGSFREAVHNHTSLGTASTAAADFDGDLLMDLATADYWDGAVGVFLGVCD